MTTGLDGCVTIAIIGSFRAHYSTILETMKVFEDAAVTVTSPRRSRVIDADRDFVRLESDPPNCDDPEIQLKALHKILGAQAVYVVAPGGYVGKTTCYEIGRVHERGIPLFFSEMPNDLPIPVSRNSIVSPNVLAERLSRLRRVPQIDDRDLSSETRRLHKALISRP